MNEGLKIYILTSKEVTPALKALSVEAGADGIFNRIDTENIFNLFGQQNGRRIALVDDSPSGLNSAKRFLEAIGATEIVTYNNPKVANSEIQKRQPPFDTIFTDLVMPEMTGLELTLSLRKGITPQ